MNVREGDRGIGIIGPNANNRLSEAQAICKESDVIIACMGLDQGFEGEQGDKGNIFASGDKPNLLLPGIQEEQLKVMMESSKAVILLLNSGRLPMTFYMRTQELTEFTDYSMRERTYRYLATEPLYPFGYGLSYTDFAVSDMKLTGNSTEGLTVSVKGKKYRRYVSEGGRLGICEGRA